jgi:diketogulonate reductase-like aldo/keto reductase
MMKTATLPSGERVPTLGSGTWYMGEHRASRGEEIATLQTAIDRGVSLVDTAEMYAEGGAERLVGEAIRGRRDRVFLVSKVYPHNASRDGTTAACERSLRRLETDSIDLYLLHWRGRVPLDETVEAFERLRTAGKIRNWGVSNFDVADINEVLAVSAGQRCSVNQVLYNLSTRGIEWGLEPLCRRQGIPIMAYSPLDQGRLLPHPRLRALASSNGLTPAQLALAWTLRRDQVIAIPKAATRQHLDENLAAWEVELGPAVLDDLDRLFKPPTGPKPLAML